MQHTISIATSHGPVRVGSADLARRRRTSHSARVSRSEIMRRSALATGAATALIIAAVGVAALGMLAEAEPPAPASWMNVRVEPNASLWTLASAHPVEGLSTAETVALIERENGLAVGGLQVGETLLVPAETSSATALAQR
jgi:hypothetical protein